MTALMQFIALLGIRIRNIGVYKFDLFSTLVGSLIPFVGYVLYWLSIILYATDKLIYSNNDIILYYMFAFLLGFIYSDEIAFSIGEDISHGKMNAFLLLPCNYLIIKLSEYISGSIFVIVVLVILMLYISIASSIIATSISAVMYSTLLIVISVLFYFIYLTALGLITVWMKNIQGMLYFQRILTSLLSGMVIPLSLLPSKLQWLLWNPFAFTMYVPSYIMIFNEVRAEYFIAALSWLAMMIFIYKLIWKFAIKDYQAYGG